MQMARAGVRPAFDPEAGLTLTKTIAPTTTYTGFTFTELVENAVFAADVTFSVSPSVGYLAEFGGTGYGAWIGIEASNNFRLRGGDGNASSPNDGNAFLDTSNFPKDGEMHTVVWDFRVAVGRVRLWIDGVFLGEAFTTAGGDLGSTRGLSRWAGGNDTSYINGPSSQVATGESSTGWHNPTGASDLRFYANQLVTA
jgi:hypothetical protein